MAVKKINKENRLVTALYCIADALNDHWIIKAIFQALPIIWSTLVLHALHDTFYDSTTGNLTREGFGIAIFICIISTALLVLTDIKSSKDKKKNEATENAIFSYQAEVNLRKVLTESETILEDRRNRHFRHSVEDLKNDEPVHSFVSKAMYPMERISTALEGLSECFSSLSGIKKSDFTLSGAIAIENTNCKSKSAKWEWISISTMEGTASINTLLHNKSSFKLVADGKPFFYANDKLEASKKGQYYLDGRDRSFGPGSGSIVCSEIDEEIKNWRIRLIISISTYGKKIISDEEIKNGADLSYAYEDLIRDTIIKQFEGELKEDLLWYAVEKIDFEKNTIRSKH